MPDDTSTTEGNAVDTNEDGDTGQSSATDDLGDAGKKALEAERSRAKAAERELKIAQRALEAERAKGLSEAERAIAEAERNGYTRASQEAGKRLARAEIRASAAAKGLDVTEILEDLDLARFVDENGEPDEKAISKAITKWAAIAPASARPRGEVDQGTRGTSQGADMNSWIRQAAGRA